MFNNNRVPGMLSLAFEVEDETSITVQYGLQNIERHRSVLPNHILFSNFNGDGGGSGSS